MREAKEAGEAIGEFAEPFLKVGGWLVENPGLITGTIAGVGTALGTYKIASGVMSLAGALGALGRPDGQSWESAAQLRSSQELARR